MPEHYHYSSLESMLFPSTRLNMARLGCLLRGKTILITGATYGIGESLAYKLGTTGVHLVLIARTEEKLLKIKSEIESKGGIVTIFPVDLTQASQVEQLINSLLLLPNGIDVVVNNAGKSIRRSIFDSLDRYHDFTRSMAINYLGPVQLMLALIPLVERQKGQFINISAINVLLPPASHWSAYQSSKSAFDQWFRSVSPELKEVGVSCSSVYLPLVKTRMITPTLQYKDMPAMAPAHVATIICKTMITRQKTYSPWWFGIVRLLSFLFRPLWDFGTSHFMKNK